MGDICGSGLHAAAISAQLLGADREKCPGRQGIAGGGQRFQHAEGKVPQFLQPLALTEQQSGEVPILFSRGQQGFCVLPCLPQHIFHPLPHPARLADAEKSGAGEVVKDGSFLRPWQQLHSGQQQRIVQIFCPALGKDVKGAHGIYLIIKKLAPDRLLHQRREYIQNASPQSKLAHTLHLVSPAVTGFHQTARKRLQVVAATGLQRDGSLPQPLRRTGFLQQRLSGSYHDAAAPVRQFIEGRNTAVFPLPGDDSSRPDEKFPGREPQNRTGSLPLAQQDGQILRQPVGLPLIGTDHDQRPLGPRGHRSGDLCAVNAAQAGDGGGTASAFDGGG